MAAEFRLRGYTVERLLGRGASGEVWRARVGSAGAVVALKRIPTTDERQRERARAEAALLCALDHPNLVRLHSVVPTGDALVLVLDLADGGSLADLLADRGRLAPGEVITAVAPVAAALAYLHGEGVTHGDVSAANVLFTPAGVPLLADVGVARLAGDHSGAEATPAYVDPAVAAGSVPGPPSDVFMLGGVALHALTGSPPWPAPDAATALALAARGELGDVPHRLAAAGVTPTMAAVVARALDVDPQRRGTAADLALDLRHSGRPVAVELAAGRRPRLTPVAWTGPRHAAGATGVAPQPSGSAARPAFSRPGEVEPAAPPPTRAVAPRPRPEIPRPPRRRTRPRGVLLATAAALAVLGAGGAVWSRAGGSPADPRGEVETRVAAASPALTTSRPSGGPSTSAPASHPPRRSPAAARWPAVLAELDAVRARAFATRDPALLSRVYADPALAAIDAATLRRLVPPGCGLAGARTRYRDVEVSRASARGAGRVTIRATATLPAAQVVCAGRARATVPGAGPTRLRLVVAMTAAGPRIAGQVLDGS